MTLIEAAKQALDLIEGEFPYLPEDRAYAAITALRTAIAGAEKQEAMPVVCPDCFGSEFPGTIRGWRCKTCDGTACVDAPVSDPVAWMVYTLDGQSVCVTDNPADFGESHRALPLYPTPPAAQQEPVVYCWVNSKGWLTYGEMPHDSLESTPLYTTPPAAQPTDDYASEADTEELTRIGQLPEPLRLAAMLEKTMQWPLHGKAADCLRRMYEAQRQPLTDEEFRKLMLDLYNIELKEGDYADDILLVRAVEAAHGITGEKK